MKLRKHIKNKYIDSINFCSLDRVLKLEIGENFKIMTLTRRYVYQPNIGISVGWDYPWCKLKNDFNWDNLSIYYNYFEKWETGKIRELLINNNSPIIWIGN